jgi:hypothetical protein
MPTNEIIVATVDEPIMVVEPTTTEVIVATGQRGPAGTDAHYSHAQGVPATVWTVAHNLGKYPAVTVMDSAGTEVEGSVVHDTTNQLTITFSAAFSGRAVCN